MKMNMARRVYIRIVSLASCGIVLFFLSCSAYQPQEIDRDPRIGRIVGTDLATAVIILDFSGLGYVGVGEELSVILYLEAFADPYSKEKFLDVEVMRIADIEAEEIMAGSDRWARCRVIRIYGEPETYDRLRPRVRDPVMRTYDIAPSKRKWLENPPEDFQEEWLAQVPFRRGQQAFRQRNYEAAIGYLEEALAYNSEDADILSWLGISHLQAGRIEESMVTLEKACGLDADNLTAWVSLANAYLKRGRQEQLENLAKCYENIARLLPDSYSAWLDLGNAYRESGRKGKAIQAYKRAVGILESGEASYELDRLMEVSSQDAEP